MAKGREWSRSRSKPERLKVQRLSEMSEIETRYQERLIMSWSESFLCVRFDGEAAKAASAIGRGHSFYHATVFQ
jgi:hypothetical protein